MKSEIKIKHKNKLYGYSHDLIKNATPEEKELHSLVKELPYRIYFQKVIPPYIVDFVIRNILIVELDGKQHEENIEYDSYRDNYLKKYGFEILRFSNEEFNNNKKDVFNLISDTAKALLRDRVVRGKKRINRIIRDYETNWTLAGANKFRHRNYDFDLLYGFKRVFAAELNNKLQKIL